MMDRMGTSIAGARLGEPLGTGPTGAVYRAVDDGTGEALAVKIIDPSLASSPPAARRFELILSAAAPLSHPNIGRVRRFGAEPVGDAVWLYVHSDLQVGGSLREALQRLRPVPLIVALELARQTAEALAHAHGEGVVHEGIRPENLLFGYPTQGRVPRAPDLLRVGDFGLARLQDGFSASMWPYLSPEQCAGGTVDDRSDLYSLGAVLYELCTGTPPFRPASFQEACRLHLEAPPGSPRALRPDLPALVEGLIVRCLVKNPAERCRDARTLADLLLEVMAALPHSQPQAAPPAPTPRPAAVAPDAPAPAAAAVPEPCPARAPAVGEPSEGEAPPAGTAAARDLPALTITYPGGAPVEQRQLTGPTFSIGRHSSNDLVVEERQVSGKHLRLEWDGCRMTATDLGSTNGTFLNGRRLEANVPEEWSPDDPLLLPGHHLSWQPPAGWTPPPARGGWSTETLEAAPAAAESPVTAPSAAEVREVIAAYPEDQQDYVLPVSRDQALDYLDGVRRRVEAMDDLERFPEGCEGLILYLVTKLASERAASPAEFTNQCQGFVQILTVAHGLLGGEAPAPDPGPEPAAPEAAVEAAPEPAPFSPEAVREVVFRHMMQRLGPLPVMRVLFLQIEGGADPSPELLGRLPHPKWPVKPASSAQVIEEERAVRDPESGLPGEILHLSEIEPLDAVTCAVRGGTYARASVSNWSFQLALQDGEWTVAGQQREWLA